MKSLIKIFLTVIVLMAVLAMVAVFTLIFSPGLQKTLLVKFLESRPGVEASVEEVQFGLSSVYIRGLDVTAGPESLSIGLLDAKLGNRGFIATRLKLDELTLEDLLLDVRASGGGSFKDAFLVSETDSVATETGLEGAFTPIPIEIGKVRGNGTVRGPNDLDLSFNIRIDNLRPLQAGAIGLDLDVSASGPQAPFESAELRLTGALAQNSSSVIERFEGHLALRLLENHSTDWVAATLEPHFTGGPTEFALVMDSLNVRKGETLLVTGQLKANGTRPDGGMWLVGYSTDLNSNLALVSALPMIPLTEPLASGLLECRLSGQVVEAREATLNGTIEVSNLRPAGYAGRGISLAMEPALIAGMMDSSLKLNGDFRLSGPATTTIGSLSANLKPGGEDRTRFEALLDLDSFNPAEWQPFIASFAGEERGDRPAAERDPSPDAIPPWAPLEGEATFRIGQLPIGESSFQDAVATVTIDAGRAIRTQLSARSGETPIEAIATLSFNPGISANPYALDGALKVKELDVTPFLRSSGTRRPVILEGIFDVSGTFQSSAPNLAFLQDSLTGDFLLKSAAPGIFRPLGEKTSLATGISGLLGALGGESNKVGWVQEVIDQLKEIPFNQMSFQFGREDNLNLFLRDLDLVSRETRIRGKGLLQYREGTALAQLPMDLQFQLFAKGKLAQALQKGNQLRSDQADDLGFYPGPPLPLRGSLAEPESLLINLLMESGTQLLPGLLGPRN